MTPTAKRLSTLVLFAMALLPQGSLHAMAQPQPPQPPREGKCRPHFQPGQFVKDLTAYITRQAGLTESEAKAFFPVLYEMRGKQRDIQRRIEKSLSQGAARDMSAADYRRILDGVATLERKKTRVTTDYVARLSRMVGAEKTVKALAAEQSFGRGQFRKMAEKRK